MSYQFDETYVVAPLQVERATELLDSGAQQKGIYCYILAPNRRAFIVRFLRPTEGHCSDGVHRLDRVRAETSAASKNSQTQLLACYFGSIRSTTTYANTARLGVPAVH